MEELTAREIGTDRGSHISKALIVYLYVKKKISDIFFQDCREPGRFEAIDRPRLHPTGNMVIISWLLPHIVSLSIIDIFYSYFLYCPFASKVIFSGRYGLFKC